MLQDYAYVNTRIRAMIPMLLKREEIETLINARNFSEYLGYLSKNYRELSSSIEIKDLENSLRKNLSDTFSTIIAYSSENSSSLLRCLSKRYEIENTKITLRSKEGEKKREEIISMLQEKYNLDVEEDASLLDIEVSLDRYYFSRLQSSITKLCREDRRIASVLVSMWIDTLNIPMILRLATKKEDKFIIPNGSLSREVMDECLSLGNIHEIVSRLSNTMYGETLRASLNEYKRSNSLMNFEINLKRFFIDRSYRIMRKNMLNIGLILGFLVLKTNEIENLRAIGTGISEGLNRNEIREMVVMPPN